jgi:hypothetical protein
MEILWKSLSGARHAGKKKPAARKFCFFPVVGPHGNRQSNALLACLPRLSREIIHEPAADVKYELKSEWAGVRADSQGNRI